MCVPLFNSRIYKTLRVWCNTANVQKTQIYLPFFFFIRQTLLDVVKLTQSSQNLRRIGQIKNLSMTNYTKNLPYVVSVLFILRHFLKLYAIFLYFMFYILYLNICKSKSVTNCIYLYIFCQEHHPTITCLTLKHPLGHFFPYHFSPFISPLY